MSLTLEFNGRKVKNGSTIPLALAKLTPELIWDRKDDRSYIVAFIDLTIGMLHWLIVVPKSTGAVRSFTEIIDYLEPSPPPGQTHLYAFFLFDATYHPLSAINAKDRKNYNANTFGKLLATIQFNTGEAVAGGDPYFKPGTPLTERQRAFCRCLAHVKKRQDVISPPAVCAKTTGTSSRECSVYYNFENFPDDELIGWATREKMTIPSPYNRQALLALIHQKLIELGKE